MTATTNAHVCYIRIRVQGMEPVCYAVSRFPCHIGRAASNDIVIPDASVSSLHAIFALGSQNNIIVEDQRSTNGIYLGTQRVSQLTVDRSLQLVMGKAKLDIALDVADLDAMATTEPDVPAQAGDGVACNATSCREDIHGEDLPPQPPEPDTLTAPALPATSADGYRYWAFISYSSKDKSWGQWLHRAIETYGVPAELINHHQTPTGHLAPPRFQPVFRDRDELPASSDLGAVIKDSLKASRYLIVICSPNAARSYWVNAEIESFLSFGRRDQILAIIVGGEPNSNGPQECFPPALRQFEPIAADARRTGDGKTNAKLKLLAGMLGVGFDALKQRDTRRRARRRMVAGCAAALLMILLTVLSSIAVRQFRSARTERGTAERRLYMANMLKIQNAWEQGDRPLFTELLKAQSPKQRGDPDYRGFEWYYWQKQSWEAQNLVHMIVAHGGIIAGVCFSPDGLRLASVSGEEGTAKVWDAATGKIVSNLNLGAGPYGSTANSVAFSPDGRLVAVGMSGYAVVCDAASGKAHLKVGQGKEITRPSFSPFGQGKEITRASFSPVGQDIEITRASFSPDGRRILTGDGNGTVRLWDAANGRELLALANLADDEGRVDRVSFSPDGRQIAVCGEDGTIRLWDAEDGRERRVLAKMAPDDFTVTGICFSPDGARIAWCGWETMWRSNASDTEIQKFLVQQQRRIDDEIKKLPQGVASEARKALIKQRLTRRSFFHDIFVSSDRKRMAQGGRQIIKVLDTLSGAELIVYRGKENASVGSLCFSPDGRWLAMLSDDGEGLNQGSDPGGECRLLDASSGKEQVVLERQFNATGDIFMNDMAQKGSLRFSPDGARLMLSGCRMMVWDTANGRILRAFMGDQMEVMSDCFSPDGQLHVMGDAVGMLSITDVTSSGPSLFRVDTKHRISPDGRRVASLGPDGVTLWDVKTRRSVQRIGDGGEGSPGSFSPDGRLLVVPERNGLSVWDATSGARLSSMSGAQRVESVRVSHDGRMLAAARADGGGVSVWDVGSGKELVCLKDTTGFDVLGFSQDGTQLVAAKGLLGQKVDRVGGCHLERPDAAMNHPIAVWNVATGKQIRYIKSGPAVFVALSSDGRRVATINICNDTPDTDRVVVVWDVATGGKLRTIKGHTLMVGFSPDGKRLVVNPIHSISMYDVATGAKQGTIGDIRGGPFCFSPDGKRIAGEYGKTAVKLWDTETGQELLTLKGHGATITDICFSPDGTRLTAGYNDGAIRIWSASRAANVTGESFEEEDTALQASMEEEMYGEEKPGPTVKVWNLRGEDGMLVEKPIAVSHSGGVSRVRFSHDGVFVVSFDADAKHLARLWSAADGAPRGEIQSPGPFIEDYCVRLAVQEIVDPSDCFALAGPSQTGYVPRVCIGRQGLLAAAMEGTVKVWDVAKGREILSFDCPGLQVVSLSPDCKRVNTFNSGAYQMLHAWDAEDGRKLHAIRLDGDRATIVRFSPDGTRLALVSRDPKAPNSQYPSYARILDVANGKELFRSPNDSLTDICFSFDGKYMATSNREGIITIYDVETGESIHEIYDAWGIASICFSPDGRLLAAGYKGCNTER